MWQWAGQLEAFIEEWLRRRAERPYDCVAQDSTIYTNNYTENAMLCKPHRVFRFEDLESGELHAYIGAAMVRRPHRNKTSGRESWEQLATQMTDRLRKGIEDWAAPDIERWYDRL
jgi:hypothetical protein